MPFGRNIFYSSKLPFTGKGNQMAFWGKNMVSKIDLPNVVSVLKQYKMHHFVLNVKDY